MKPTSSALGLFRYGGGAPAAALFARFLSMTESLFMSLKITPTYIDLDGEGFPAGFTRFEGRGHKRALKQGLEGVRSVSLAANPKGSDEPMFDSFALASLAFVPSTEELLLSLEVNEAWLPFGGEAYRLLVEQFLLLAPWRFGFGFADHSSKQPSFHIQSLDPGNLSPEERTRLRAWYAVPPETRCRRLRDVYALNLLGPDQLSEPTRDGQSLQSLLSALSEGDIKSMPGTALIAWSVPDAAARDSARKHLSNVGALAGR